MTYTVDPVPTQEKPWGRERILAAVEGQYVGKLIELNDGQAVSLQYHREKAETVSVLSGRMHVEIGPVGGPYDSFALESGSSLTIPAGIVHRFTAEGDLVFMEISRADPGWRTDVIRIEDAFGRAGTTQP